MTEMTESETRDWSARLGAAVKEAEVSFACTWANFWAIFETLSVSPFARKDFEVSEKMKTNLLVSSFEQKYEKNTTFCNK